MNRRIAVLVVALVAAWSLTYSLIPFRDDVGRRCGPALIGSPKWEQRPGYAQAGAGRAPCSSVGDDRLVTAVVVLGAASAAVAVTAVLLRQRPA